MRYSFVLFSLLLLGCDVSMGPALLQPSLFLEVRDPEVIAQVCPSSVPQSEVDGATAATLKVDQVEAKRSLFGNKGHGTAHVEFRPKNGAPCTGTVEFDFSQDSRIVGRTRRSVRTSNDFYYANLVVKRP